ncbi:MAG: serine hydrolase domain-containing protein [Bacteroidia bacterium]|nr:serine hydrolase domain-containing protein [Bacteroidia bacterium]
MLLRISVFLGVTALLSLLPRVNFQRSQASIGLLSRDSLWTEWADVSLQLMKSDQLASYFENLYCEKRFNGAVLISKNSTVLYEKGFGLANEKTAEPITPDTPFQLASVSKMFTATAIMLLYQEGKLDFDDTISQHLPGWPYENMTIRHLLNHRSGLARYEAVSSWYWKNYHEPLSNADVLSQYIEHKPVIFFTPDSGFNYCNTNYVILACLVEKVSGMPFEQFMATRVFQPLCMDHSTIHRRISNVEVPGHAVGYKPSRKGYFPAGGDYLDGVVGDKGMYASVRDIAKFDAALSNHVLLNPSTLENAFEPGSGNRIHNYGFGWRLRIFNDHKIIYHFGWWRGFRTCFIRDPQSELTIVILTNRDEPGHYVDYWEAYDYVKEVTEYQLIQEAL